MATASTAVLFVGTIATATLMPQCGAGFEVAGAICADTNECTRDNPCEDAHTRVCSESSTDPSVAAGAYLCACLEGFTGINCA